MKALIILAAFLLIPIIMKFQEGALTTEVIPTLAKEVEVLLANEGVTAPQVRMSYLDATISGHIQSWQAAEEVTGKVLALRGVRRVNNELTIRGSLRATRQGETVLVSGLVPEGWGLSLTEDDGRFDLSNLRERERTLLDSKDSLAWGSFLKSYFQGTGHRSCEFDGQELILTGEATPSLAKSLSAAAAKVVPPDSVQASFQLYPSPYHYPLRVVESPLDGEALRELQRYLLEHPVTFQEGTTAYTATGEELLNDLVGRMLASDSGLQFIVGSYPRVGGASDRLAPQRAQAVRSHLIAAGIPATSLEAATYEMTEDSSEFAGQVEVLLR